MSHTISFHRHYRSTSFPLFSLAEFSFDILLWILVLLLIINPLMTGTCIVHCSFVLWILLTHRWSYKRLFTQELIGRPYMTSPTCPIPWAFIFFFFLLFCFLLSYVFFLSSFLCLLFLLSCLLFLLSTSFFLIFVLLLSFLLLLLLSSLWLFWCYGNVNSNKRFF